MYRIGDFAAISKVSIKMLRHYDEIGLLKPAAVDPFTGYRSYMLDQLPRLNRIMALKSMGFSLAEIRELLNTPLSLEQIRVQAEEKQAELVHELQTMQEKLTNLQTWMRRIELENAMPEYEIILKPLSPTSPDIPKPTERPVTLPLPVSAGFTDDILLHPDHFPQPTHHACVIHSGPRDDLIQAYRALDTWIRSQHCAIAGVPQEIVLQTNGDNEYIIEVKIPVAMR